MSIRHAALDERRADHRARRRDVGIRVAACQATSRFLVVGNPMTGPKRNSF